MMLFDDRQERCSSTPKLPLFSFPMNRATETPGLATPPVNIAGTVPFLWEEAPGKPRASGGDAVVSEWSGKKQNGVVRCLELPPRLSLPAANEPSPTTVLDGPYIVRRRSLSLPRSESLRKGGPKPAKEKGLFGSTRWGGSSGKIKEIVEGKIDVSRSTAAHFSGDGGTKVKISRVRRKKSLLNLNLSYPKSHFWGRVCEGFRQVIPWRRRQENLRRMNSSII
ncbi:PREDICTED: uncharacterized protein At4g00950-like [Tarenaya hassleriana]|uniref:uncharacterized protein At4g00950-like n=1 Tax=Tarenaya hassleriana TaxID=28532 RepID=UPI00053C1D1D|nr:PREDICTED: uncharacterized protein At4g00950-like [Tarenaya hassleriana]